MIWQATTQTFVSDINSELINTETDTHKLKICGS